MFQDFAFRICPGWNVTLKPIALIAILVLAGLLKFAVGAEFQNAFPAQNFELPVLQNANDKKSISSLSGEFVLTLTPDESGGRGGGAYELRRNGRLRWRKHLPFWLHDLVIGKKGTVMGYSEDFETLRIWHLSAKGKAALLGSYPRGDGAGTDGPPLPTGGSLLQFDLADEALMQIAGVRSPGKKNSFSDLYLFIDLARGEIRRRWVDPPGFNEQFYISDVASIRGANLIAFAAWDNDRKERIRLFDRSLKKVADVHVSSGYDWDDPTAYLDPDDRGTFLPCPGNGHFAVRAKKERIEFAVTATKREGVTLREVARQPYDPIAIRRAPILASPRVDLKTVRVLTAEGGAFKLPDSSRFEVSPSGAIFIADRESESLTALNPDGSRRYVWKIPSDAFTMDPSVTLNRNGSAYFGGEAGIFFAIDQAGKMTAKWLAPESVKAVFTESYEAGEGLRWVASFRALLLLDEKGRVIKHYLRRRDGGLIDVPAEFATASDGSLCMVCRPQPEVALATLGDPAHLCFYGSHGEDRGCIRMPAGGNFRLEGFNGRQFFLASDSELVCYDSSGKPLWHCETKAFQDVPHFITRDGAFLVVRKGAEFTFFSLPGIAK